MSKQTLLPDLLSPLDLCVDSNVSVMDLALSSLCAGLASLVDNLLFLFNYVYTQCASFFLGGGNFLAFHGSA